MRHLLIDHDIGQKFRVGSTYVLALEEATVQGALSVSNNCSISGQLTVNGVNVLSSLNAAQSSTGPIAISDVSGLTAALSGKQATLGSTSTLQLSELTCARVKPATGTLSLADFNGVERLGLATMAVFSCPVSALPSM